MKRLIYIITILVAIGSSGTMEAVTDKEMEQARVIATLAYLRYANDGSGYLDEMHPKTMADLEKGLKAKEKENIKAFKAIAVPSGYQSWDKERLADYWTKAFTSKGLIEKGRIGRQRARKRIIAMSISTPVKEETPKEETKATSAPADVKPAATQPEQQQNNSFATGTPTATPADSLVDNGTELQALQALEGEDEEPLDKAENHTWVYIVILVILVGVVVALVVFASNVMKKNEARTTRNDGLAPTIPTADVKSDSQDINVMREKFAAKLTEKNNEVHSLNRKVEELNAQNASLKKNLEALTAETAVLRTRLSEARQKIAGFENTSRQTPCPAPAQPVQQTQAAQTQTHRQSPALRTIYLGRANSKGIFVRADRSLNIGNSIFRLDTTDGYAGSFRVVDDPTVWDMALLTPRESLAGACVSPELDNTEGKEKIVNDSSGTAIFEGGCWKVIRKAKIHYE